MWKKDMKPTSEQANETVSYLYYGPFSFKGLKVALNHLKFNIPSSTKRKMHEIFLITFYSSFGIEFQPKCQVLLTNLFQRKHVRYS